MKAKLVITGEVVCSTFYSKRAAKAFWDAYNERYTVTIEDIQTFLRWSITGGYFPTDEGWGSGWFVEVPYVLNEMINQGKTDSELKDFAFKLFLPDCSLDDEEILKAHNDAWKYAHERAQCYRVQS